MRELLFLKPSLHRAGWKLEIDKRYIPRNGRQRESSARYAIVESLPNISKLKGVENLTDISIALTSAIRRLDPSQNRHRRVCIGLVSDVLLQHHAVQTRRWLAGLIARAHEKETEKGLGKYLKIKIMSSHKYLEKEVLLKKEERKQQRVRSEAYSLHGTLSWRELMR